MRPAATLRLHDSHATAVAWLPDRGLLSAGLDGHLRVVAPDLAPRPPGTPQGKGLVSLALDPGDSGRALPGDLDGARALGDLEAGAAAPPIQAHAGPAQVAWPARSGPVSAGGDGLVRSWKRPPVGPVRVPALEPDRELATAATGERVHWLSVDRSGVFLAAAGAGGPLRLWAAGRFEEWADLGRAVAGLAVHPEALEVAVVTFSGHLEVRHIPDGAMLRSSPKDYAQAVCPLAWSPDGSRLAVGGDGRVRLLDGASLEVLAEDRFPAETPGLAFSGDGGRLAVPGTDGRVRVYQLGDL